MRTFFIKLGRILQAFPVLIALLVLCVWSIFIIMSATSTNEALKNAYSNQIVYLVIGLVVYFAIGLTSYERFLRLGPILYTIAIVLLIACYIPHLGKKVYGAHSWIKLGPIGFEPAEFAKLSYILGLAWFLRLRERSIQSLSTVAIAILITLIPFALILKQPALGSASVFFPVCFCMLFAAGARVHHVLIPIVLVSGLLVMTYYWFHVWDRGGSVRIFRHEITFMKPFQVNRMKIFFDPSLDRQGASWQINQSLIAIGSGGLHGKGWRQGTQNVLGYLPKNTSYNDLIFSVVGEEFGFLGGAALIIGEGTVLLWCLWVATRARDKIGALLAVGIMAMLFTHIFVNIGMTIQVVPITGIPLPFISYGGTFLIACLTAMGLVQSVWVHRKNFDRA